jgi:hypothetical protein
MFNWFRNFFKKNNKKVENNNVTVTEDNRKKTPSVEALPLKKEIVEKTVTEKKTNTNRSTKPRGRPRKSN